jgi:hypothetical protein
LIEEEEPVALLWVHGFPFQRLQSPTRMRFIVAYYLPEFFFLT